MTDAAHGRLEVPSAAHVAALASHNAVPAFLPQAGDAPMQRRLGLYERFE